MGLYGFKEREVARLLKQFAKYKLADNSAYRMDMAPPEIRDNVGGVFLAYVDLGGIPAATQDQQVQTVRTLGKASCQLLTTFAAERNGANWTTFQGMAWDDSFNVVALPQMSFETAASYPSSDIDSWIANADSFATIYNVSDKPIEEKTFIIAVNVDGVMIAIPPGGEGGEVTPRIQFVTTSKMNNMQCNSTCIRKIGLPVQADNTPIVPGDTVQLNDPFNLWSNVEIGATGWAHWVPERLDSNDPQVVVHPARWEIESCTQPINKLEVRLQKCLLPPQSPTETFPVTFGIDEVLGDSIGAIPVQNSDIDLPPEAVYNDTAECDYYSLEVYNPYNLDAIPGSMCTIERVTDLRMSEPVDPANLNEQSQWQTPRARSSTTAQWAITSVAQPFARHIKATYAGSFTKSEHYDGYWPPGAVGACPTLTLCDPVIECGGNCDCLETGDFGYGFLALNNNGAPEVKYIITSTQSALYGEAKDFVAVEDVTFANCSVTGPRKTIKTFCEPTSAGDITGGTLSGSSKTLQVPTGTEIYTESRTCGGGSCLWLYDYTGTNCGDSVTWSWDIPSGDWIAQNSCTSGDCEARKPPPPDDPNAANPDETTPCIDRDTSSTPEWTQATLCSGNCSCELPTEQNPVVGQYYPGTCPDTGVTEEYLCVETSYEAVTVFEPDCGGGGNPPAAQQPTKSCIEITEDCPDACGNAGP